MENVPTYTTHMGCANYSVNCMKVLSKSCLPRESYKSPTYDSAAVLNPLRMHAHRGPWNMQILRTLGGRLNLWGFIDYLQRI